MSIIGACCGIASHCSIALKFADKRKNDANSLHFQVHRNVYDVTNGIREIRYTAIWLRPLS